VKSPGNPWSQSWRRNGRLRWEGFAEMEGFKPGVKERGGKWKPPSRTLSSTHSRQYVILSACQQQQQPQRGDLTNDASPLNCVAEMVNRNASTLDSLLANKVDLVNVFRQLQKCWHYCEYSLCNSGFSASVTLAVNSCKLLDGLGPKTPDVSDALLRCHSCVS